MNTHQIPDTMSEIQSICEDLLPACVLSTTFPTVPGSGMVLAAFATHGYVLDGQNLIYVEQPAVSVTLTGSAGTYWLAIHRDTSSAVAGWTRRPGSHYLWQTNATQPANPAGALVFCQVVVTGATISAVTPLADARSPISKQLSTSVTITGGSITGLTQLQALNLQVFNRGGANQVATSLELSNTGEASRFNVNAPGNALNYLAGGLGIQTYPTTARALNLVFRKDVQDALIIQPTVQDTLGGGNLTFLNLAGSIVGRITSDATTTSYATSSDARLKHAIAALSGALDAITALRPVQFRWNATDSQDEGFLAHELQQVLPHAVSGEADAVNADGSVRPQQVDHSKLVVWLVGAVQELAARVTSLEEQLGL